MRARFTAMLARLDTGRRGRLRARATGSESGFTLVELLGIVVVVGILVAVAIPLYINYRNGADNDSVKSDIRGAIAAETRCRADQDATSASYRAGASGSPGQSVSLLCVASAPTVSELVRVSEGNTLAITVPSAKTFKIVGRNAETGKAYTYLSADNSWH